MPFLFFFSSRLLARFYINIFFPSSSALNFNLSLSTGNQIFINPQTNLSCTECILVLVFFFWLLIELRLPTRVLKAWNRNHFSLLNTFSMEDCNYFTSLREACEVRSGAVNMWNEQRNLKCFECYLRISATLFHGWLGSFDTLWFLSHWSEKQTSEIKVFRTFETTAFSANFMGETKGQLVNYVMKEYLGVSVHKQSDLQFTQDWLKATSGKSLISKGWRYHT